MTEGWSGQDYLIWFEQRAAALHDAYGLARRLPGYRLLGLRSWDDFIVADPQGRQFTVPTVPAVQAYLATYAPLSAREPLRPDPIVAGRVKWYVTPLVFGGDPRAGDNVIWVSLEQHTQLVQFWNRKYDEVRPSNSAAPAV